MMIFNEVRPFILLHCISPRICEMPSGVRHYSGDTVMSKLWLQPSSTQHQGSLHGHYWHFDSDDPLLGAGQLSSTSRLFSSNSSTPNVTAQSVCKHCHISPDEEKSLPVENHCPQIKWQRQTHNQKKNYITINIITGLLLIKIVANDWIHSCYIIRKKW